MRLIVICCLGWQLFNQIILRFVMIDRVLNFGPVQQDSYYFQLIPLSLAIVNTESELPASGTTYRFTVSKGAQKFDENKIPIEASFQVVAGRPVMVINTCRLNFYLPNYSKLRKQEFSFAVVQREHNQDYGLGEYRVNVDQLVADFKDNNKARHEFKVNFSEDYELEFEIYVDKNRMALERNIRENKTERINKSPLRNRKEEQVESPKRSFSPRTDQPEQQTVTPSRDTPEQPQPTPDKEEQPQLQEAPEVKQEAEKTQEVSPEPQQQQEEPKSEKAAAASSSRAKPAEKSEKNQVQSKRTGQNVPMVSTKFKQLARGETPSEVNLEHSMRLSVPVNDSAPKPVESNELKEKVTLWLFLLLGAVVTYFAMHPNKKV